MRKITVAVAAAALSLMLAGCETTGLGTALSNLGTGVSIVTKTIANPVTRTEEAQIEAGINAAINVLQGYKKACIAGTADKNCRANVAAIQVYTRKMTPLIAQLRDFVDNNDQINAVVVYNQLTALYANVKATAASLGYNIGNLP